MIQSMTGYGRNSVSNEIWNVEAEIKSVNSRYLEIFLRLPQVLLNREFELRELLKSKIKRGKLSVSLTLKKNGNVDDTITLDEAKLKNYVALIKKVKKASKITEKIKLEHILSSREIFSNSLEELSDSEFELIKKCLFGAIDNFVEMRKKEGAELEKDLKKRVKIIEDKLALIESESSSSVNENFEKYKERVRQLLDREQNADFKERLESELAILVEKSDITEECVRLKSHIKFFIDSIKNDEEPGRKLNFLCQEMNRESNTISAKTLSTSITHNTVLIREEIERLREQIQNIE